MQDCIKFNGIKIAQPDEDGYSAIFATTSTDDSDRDMTLEMHNTPIGTVEGDTHLGVTSSGFVGIVGGSSRQWKHDINSIQAAEIDSHMPYGVRAREFIYNDGYLAVGDCRIGKKIPGFVVEELQEDYPIAVEFDKFGRPVNWSPRMFIAPIIVLLQEQHREIMQLKKDIRRLKKGGLSHVGKGRKKHNF